MKPTLMLAVACVALATACGGPADPGTGTVEVTTVSTGEDMDPNGYVVLLPGAGAQAIGSNATVTIAEVTAGDIEVRLTGLQGNCRVQGAYPRLIRVVSGEIFRTHFDILCARAPLLGRIVFSTTRDGNLELYSMRADGSDPVRLTTTPDDQESGAAVSPDGARIAFYSRAGDLFSDVREFDVFVMNADGTGRVNLTNDPTKDQLDPAWSPDGTQIAFASTDGDDFVTLFSRVWVVNADGSDPRDLTGTTAPFARSPAWSPDGKRILFTAAPDEQNHLYLMFADGTRQTRLTSDTTVDMEGAWSPDGTRIAFLSWRTGTAKVFVMDADGSDQAALVDGSEPSWSPDGGRLAFSHDATGDVEVFVVNADGTGMANISNSAGVIDGVGSQPWGP